MEQQQHFLTLLKIRGIILTKISDILTDLGYKKDGTEEENDKFVDNLAKTGTNEDYIDPKKKLIEMYTNKFRV